MRLNEKRRAAVARMRVMQSFSILYRAQIRHPETPTLVKDHAITLARAARGGTNRAVYGVDQRLVKGKNWIDSKKRPVPGKESLEFVCWVPQC